MSATKDNKTYWQRFKLLLVRIQLRFIEKLLHKPKVDMDQYVSKPTEPETIPLLEPTAGVADIMSRGTIDWEFNQSQNDNLIRFDLAVTTVMYQYLEDTSALVVAGPLLANALKLYRTVLSQQEYDAVLNHVYETRNQIQPIELPQDITTNTVH